MRPPGGMAAPRSLSCWKRIHWLNIDPKLGEFGYAGDDHVVPFEVGPLDVRGRTVQLGPMLDAILAATIIPSRSPAFWRKPAC